MASYSVCRFCGRWCGDEAVKYSTRHYAHFDCYLDRGRKLADLPTWQVEKFPYFLLKDRGLLDQARDLCRNRLRLDVKQS